MVQIRPMVLEDCQSVYEIDRNCFTDSWSLSMFQDLFRYPTNFYFVAEEGQRICGFAGIMVSVDTADIMNIAVQKEKRGRGIGRQLLEQLTAQAIQCGCEQMLLEVRESNQTARRLYQTCGFVEIAIRKNYYTSPTEHGIIMQLQFQK
ncbi:MAG: ribosomal protein S18-alanine N-acetyltransferase [Lachnospiraceae bacterium]|nr:ribosomal protein S18-alanine N-acetyltransferase [Lachnospiraceae bacterium]